MQEWLYELVLLLIFFWKNEYSQLFLPPYISFAFFKPAKVVNRDQNNYLELIEKTESTSSAGNTLSRSLYNSKERFEVSLKI